MDDGRSGWKEMGRWTDGEQHNGLPILNYDYNIQNFYKGKRKSAF